VNKNAQKQAKQGSGTDNPRQERKPEDRKPGPTADNVGKKDQASSQEKRSDLADAGEATEQGGSQPTSKDDDQARGHRSMHAGKASLDEAEMRHARQATDRGPERHPDEPVARSGAQPGDRKSVASRDQATHSEMQKRGEKRSGV